MAAVAVLPDQMHGVGGADGLPEDGVGPADLLAEPPQRLPDRHPRHESESESVRRHLVEDGNSLPVPDKNENPSTLAAEARRRRRENERREARGG